MKEARRAVGAFLALVATIAAGFVGVIAAGTKGSPWHKGAFIAWVIVLIVAGGLAFAAAVPDFAEWLGGPARRLMRAARRPGKLITDRWQYTSDGMKCPATTWAQELALPATSRQPPGERPPWVRVVVLAACSQISPNADSKQLWTSFEAFLERSLVGALLILLEWPDSGVGTEMRWTRWSTNRASAIDAFLTPGTEDEAVASVRLELPDGSALSGRDARCATLIVHFEREWKDALPWLPASPAEWERRIWWALHLPGAFSNFLSAELGLTSKGEPPTQLAVRLEAQKDLAEMIDITGMTQLPGRPNGVQAIGYFTASRDGAQARESAEQMITHVLRYALSIER